MKIKRRDFLVAGTLSLAAAAVRLKAEPATGQRLRLLYYTDIHSMLERQAPAGLEKAAAKMRGYSADLTICGGDLIDGGFTANHASELLPRYDLYQKFRDQIPGRVEHVLGNHDFVAAQPADGSAPDPDPKHLFRERTGTTATYRSFDFAGFHFVILDSVKPTGDKQRYRGFIEAEQVEWIKSDLRQIKPETGVILATHIPLRTTFQEVIQSSTAGLTTNLVVENAREIVELFRDHRLLLVLQGHLHVNELIRWNDVTFYLGGAVCGAWWRGPNLGAAEGFSLIDISTAGVECRYITYDWHAPAA